MGSIEAATKQCPFCAEEILAVAIKCKHCGSMINSPPLSPPVQRPPMRLDKLFFGLFMVWVVIRPLLGFAVASTGQISYLAPMWNSLIAVGIVVIFVKLRQEKEWALDWAIGSSALNALGDLMMAGKDHAPFLVFTAAIAGTATVLLVRAKNRKGLRKRKVTAFEVVLTIVLVLSAIAISAVEEQQSKGHPALKAE